MQNNNIKKDGQPENETRTSVPDLADATQTLAGMGHRLKIAREKTGITQAELAKLLGLSTSAIQNYEYGNNFPKYPHLVVLSEILKCSTDWILKGQDLQGMVRLQKEEKLGTKSKERVREVIILMERELERTKMYLAPEAKAAKVIEFIEAFEELQPVQTRETESV